MRSNGLKENEKDVNPENEENTSGTRKKPTGKRKITIQFILDFYDALRMDGTVKRAADILEIEYGALQGRIKAYPILKKVVDISKSKREEGRGNTLAHYVSQNMSREARNVWEKLKTQRVDKIGSDPETFWGVHQKGIRQQCFIQALISGGFNFNEACKMVHISKAALDGWTEEPEFQRLLKEVQWHKKNFFENALIGLVEEKHPLAVMFVNRTINADRGYSEKIQIEHSGSVAGFSIDDLNLDLETRKKILIAIRERKEQSEMKQIPDKKGPKIPNRKLDHNFPPYPVIDVEAKEEGNDESEEGDDDEEAAQQDKTDREERSVSCK